MKIHLAWLSLALWIFSTAQAEVGELYPKPPSITKYTPQLDKQNFGTYMGSVLGIHSSLEDWTLEAQKMKEAGIGMARFNSDCWDVLEPTPSQYQWEKLDAIVEILENHDIEMLFTIPIAASWNSSAPYYGAEVALTHYPTRDPQALMMFCFMLAYRYQDKITYFEAWNEPDLDIFWKGQPNPQEYFNILQNIHVGLKEANPNCKILLGGLANPLRPQYFQDLLKLGAGQFFDICNIHVYVNNYRESHRAYSFTRMHLDQEGLDYPIWVTEISSTPTYFMPGLDREQEEQRKVNYMVKNYLMLLSNGVEKIFWHSLRTGGKAIGLENDYDFALMKVDFSPLPAWYGQVNLLSILKGTKTIKSLSSNDEVMAFKLVRDGREPIYIAWSNSENARFIFNFNFKAGMSESITEVPISTTPRVFNKYGELLFEDWGLAN